MRSPQELLERADALLHTADNPPKDTAEEREAALAFATLAVAHAHVADTIAAASEPIAFDDDRVLPY